MKKIMKVFVLLLALVLGLGVVGCSKRERIIKVRWSSGGFSSTGKVTRQEPWDDGIDTEFGPVFFTPIGQYLRAIVLDENGNLVKTGDVIFASTDPENLWISENVTENNREASGRAINFGVKYVPVTVTYYEDGFDPVVKTVDFMLARECQDLDMHEAYDFDNHVKVERDDPAADFIVTGHDYLKFTYTFPYGVKVVRNPIEIANVEVFFVDYNIQPSDEELTCGDCIFDWEEYYNHVHVVKTSEGKYIKILFSGCSSDGENTHVRYAELDPSRI